MEGSSQTKEGRSPDQVREEIHRARQELVSVASALQEEVAMRMDWREWIRRRPGLFLAGAFALGFWIGTRRRQST
jgi:hypothetical protein